MKQKTRKLDNLERNRFSIITDNLNYCIVCGKPKQDLNEIFGGRNRQNSMKYGLVIPMCRNCHIKYTNDNDMQLEWKKLGQEVFNDTYNEDFVDIFKRNYL